ncbi:competence protein CoiA [Estrella lausannensis]|uniref:Transcription factor, CoiA-like family n=1 Tax=Estrella lausannensis TaxID=483423 RepID=A0A0H5E6E5_9BACT|nr:competence protein CoiA family protein [Estrella lausannensis]CRX38850.1 Transcription factor, CoiA-like family [Estrella lausannensis]
MANLTAKDAAGNTLLAPDAKRGEDYFCPECAAVVRLRLGSERRPHFFHLDPPDSCRQALKSPEHLALQLHIKHSFENQGVKANLEHRFPAINRINDVFVPEMNLGFEIQCSPMTAEEALLRIADYRRMNIDIVWVLHTMTFLKGKASSLERAIANKAHYFSSMNGKGEGEIFDLFAPLEGGMRRERGIHYPVDITTPILKSRRGSFRNERPLHFRGDLLDLLQERGLDQATTAKILFEEARWMGAKRSFEWRDLLRKGFFILKIYFDELLLSCTTGKEINDTERP